MNKKFAITTAAVLVAASVMAAVTYQDWARASAARQTISAQFNDPSSAQFRHDRFEKNGWFCGEVNAKNREGGYVGFKRFASGGKSGKQYIENHGMVGEATTDDILELLDKQTARLNERNRMRTQLPQLPGMTESELSELARNDVFAEKWKAYCT